MRSFASIFNRGFPLYLLAGVFLIAGCTSQATAQPTATSQPTSTATASPTETPIPTATAIRTPPALPAVFQTGELNPLDPPRTYISDTCQYLKDKWTSTNSAPGTVLMPIMFHSIIKGRGDEREPGELEGFFDPDARLKIPGIRGYHHAAGC